MTNILPAIRGMANAPWPFVFDGLEVVGYTTSTTTANATASATTHTKGAWGEVLSTTTAAAGLLSVHVRMQAVNATDNSMLLDIGKGSAGSETAIVSDIAVGGATPRTYSQNDGICFFLPVNIASGTRIAARVQSAVASRTAVVQVAAWKIRSSPVLPATADVIGSSTATSAGTAMSGSSGTWVQLTASSSQRYRALMLIPSVAATTTQTINTDMDIGYGAAGSEISIGTVPMFFDSGEAAASLLHAPLLPIPCDIPAGSRISVRHRLATNPGQRAVCLIGIPA